MDRKERFAVPLGITLLLTTLVSAGGYAQGPRRVERVHTEPSAAVQPRRLALAELEEIALQRNPTLIQATAQIDIARAKALQAGLYYNPVIGTDSEQVGIKTGTQGSAWGERQGGYIQQEIVTAGKLKLSRAKYQQESVQAEIQATAQQYRILNGLRIAFYDVIAEERLIEIHRELLLNAEAAVKTTEEMVNVGQANRPDLLQARIEARKARIELRTAENNYRKVWQHLITIAGAPELAISPLEGNLEPEGPALEWDSSLARLFQESPEMQLVRAEVVRDEITVNRERVQPIPNINVRVGSGYNFESRNATADASLFIKVPIFDRNQGTIRQAQAELMRAVADISRMELSLQKRFADTFARYETAWISMEAYRDEILPEAQEAQLLQQEQFRKQRQALPAVLVAQRTHQQLRMEYVKTLQELREAEVEINGLLLVDGLKQPAEPRPGGHIDATPRPR